MEIIISNSSSKPIYEQITSQMKALIMSGSLEPGQAIPSMRALAKTLHISVITVQKAYEDLQRDGFIETTVGRGSFVAYTSQDLFQEEQQKLIESHLTQAVDLAKSAGITESQLCDLIKLFYEEVK